MTTIDRQDNLPLLVAFVFSILLNAGGMVFLEMMVANQPSNLSSLKTIRLPEDDPVKEVEKKELKFTPGIENGAPATITWIGYDEYQEQLARQAEVEQAAFTMADGSPGQPTKATTTTAPATPTAPPPDSSPVTPSNSPTISPTVNAADTPVTEVTTETPDTLTSKEIPQELASSKMPAKSLPEAQKPAGEYPALTDATGDDEESEALDAKRVTEVSKPSAIDKEQPLTERPTPLPDFKTPIETHDPVSVNAEKSRAVVNQDVKNNSPTIPQKDIPAPADIKEKPVSKSYPPIQPEREPSPDSEINPSEQPPVESEEASAAPATLNENDQSSDLPTSELTEENQPTERPSDSEDLPTPADHAAKTPDEQEEQPVDTPSASDDVPPSIEPELENMSEASPANPGRNGKPSLEPRDPKAQPSDKESSATSVKPIPEFKWSSGKPLAVEGMEIKPYSLARHILIDSKDTLFTVSGWEGRVHTNPIVSLRFDHTGKVARIQVYRKSGYGEFDRKYLMSWLSRWTAYDKRLASLKKGEFTDPILIKLIFINEPKQGEKKKKNPDGQ